MTGKEDRFITSVRVEFIPFYDNGIDKHIKEVDQNTKQEEV